MVLDLHTDVLNGNPLNLTLYLTIQASYIDTSCSTEFQHIMWRVNSTLTRVLL